MAFKSSTQPLCRWCGKRIRKDTDWVYCRDQEPEEKFRTAIGRYVVASPKTKAECQALVNETVVSVRRGHNSETKDRIYSFGTWDGESYVDEFFCTGEHAKFFGDLAVRSGLCPGTKTYAEALKKQKAKT
jgi:hypothetical protein